MIHSFQEKTVEQKINKEEAMTTTTVTASNRPRTRTHTYTILVVVILLFFDIDSYTIPLGYHDLRFGRSASFYPPLNFPIMDYFLFRAE